VLALKATAPPLIAQEASSARSSAAVSLGFLLTSVLGGVLTILVARIVGEGADTDSFFAAYSVYLFFTLFGTGLRTALVPLLGSTTDQDAWRRRATDVAARLAGAGAVVMALVVVFAPLLGIALRPGDTGGRATAAASLAILAVASYCQIGSAALAAVLAGASRFVVSASLYVAAAATNLVLGTVLMVVLGILGAPLGVLGGAIVLLVGHRIYLRRFAFHAPAAVRRAVQPETRRLVRLASAGSALSLAQQLQLTIALALLANTVGAVTAYTYASFIAVLLASVTIYVVAFVMLPGVLATVERGGDDAALRSLDFVVPVAVYVYVAAAGAYAAFGLPIIEAVLGPSLSRASIDLLWDASRIFLLMNLAAAMWVPAGAVLLAMRRYRALVIPAIILLSVHSVAVAIVSDEGPLAVAIAHASAGAAVTVAVLAIGFGSRAPAAAARMVRGSLPVVPIALVYPALALLAPKPSGLLAATGLAVAGAALYVAIGYAVWPSVGRRALQLLLARTG
jgi:peptidoglycan biosynthesis protein MviN/MurJ (putative lipid II flippase)